MTSKTYEEMNVGELVSAVKQNQDVPVGQIVRAAMQLRQAKSQLKKKFDEDEAKIKRATESLEAVLLNKANLDGVNGFPTDYGRVTIRREEKPRIKDFDAFSKFIMNTGRTDFLQRRASEGNIKDYIKETQQGVPGIEVYVERKVAITKT